MPGKRRLDETDKLIVIERRNMEGLMFLVKIFCSGAHSSPPTVTRSCVVHTSIKLGSCAHRVINTDISKIKHPEILVFSERRWGGYKATVLKIRELECNRNRRIAAQPANQLPDDRHRKLLPPIV